MIFKISVYTSCYYNVYIDTSFYGNVVVADYWSSVENLIDSNGVYICRNMLKHKDFSER